MTDSDYTPAFLTLGIVLGTFLACLEILWLKRPFHFTGSAFALLLIAFLNAVFIYLMSAVNNYYLFLAFVFPCPVLPTAYVLVKALAYFWIQRMAHHPVHAPWKLAFLSLFFHAAISFFAYTKFADINPTRNSLEKAIQDKNNSRLEFLLRISGKSAVGMARLVNTAIVYKNREALEMLLRRGADPRQRYQLDRVDDLDTLWRMTKWMLDAGINTDEDYWAYANKNLPFVVMDFGPAEIEYAFQKGFHSTYRGMVTLAFSMHRFVGGPIPTPAGSIAVVPPEDIQIIKRRIRILLDHGADINGEDYDVDIPIMRLVLIQMDMSEVLTYLIENGANVNFQRPNTTQIWVKSDRTLEMGKGVTPLMIAAIANPQYVSILVKAGADKAARNANGRTALDYAREEKADPTILRLLE